MQTKSETKTYTKGQILGSQKYKDKRDMLTALLDEKKKYALADVDKLIEKYMKGTVN